jgi:hypothetical protein
VHDFPIYGLFVGCVNKGHAGCPPCGPTSNFHSSKKLKKMILVGVVTICLKANHINATQMISMEK